MSEVAQNSTADVEMVEKTMSVTVEAVDADSPESLDNTPMLTPPIPDNQGPTANDNSPGPKHQAAFVNKLYSMVEDPAIREVMWTESGSTFIVTSPIEFSKCLHNYFKHNNWQSFVRQLNMYQFHKVNDVFHSTANTNGAANTSDTAAWEFKHPYFQRGQVELLNNIRRKASRPVPQSRDSYGYQGREQQGYHHVQHPHPYEPAVVRSPHTDRGRLEQMMDSVNQRIQGIEDSQRILMDQTAAVFGALRGYQGILGGITSVLGQSMPDHNIAALQSDLQALQQQLTRSQYAPRRQMHISLPPQQMPMHAALGTPGSARSGWSQPNSPVPSIVQTPTFSPSLRSGPAEHADSYFRVPVPSSSSSQQQQQQQQYGSYASGYMGARSPTWGPSAVLSPPLSDTSRTSGEVKFGGHGHGSLASSAFGAPMRPGLGDRCRSLQSLLNTSEAEDRRRA
ncbi:HSF-type DNA-binding domain protein [Taphrina deformans PYCC 5710]|uniref:HSF-type DNA-binding domain protein n=1 Tax=Taphrina deformans (strain PYCC 5710 / ATCC 11124 / CBS 356.35 / IMI 108563 / JCM 9778 / NBRC 8474) TaxID=1097556 RepID=R4XCQ6_TAPDE|nr:HSF-type DNA-binding domain protein [Taphrina deformans PYCC 5710]|eukprot:CCG81095.1 HSF-type DNA-binding domain protein [Taphrina deformans PYCC 5710]